MMRRLGGVFGIAVAVAISAGAGSPASPATFADGFVPVSALGASLSRAGAATGLLLPARRRPGRRVRPPGPTRRRWGEPGAGNGPATGRGGAALRVRVGRNRLPRRACAAHARSVIDLPAAATATEYRAIARATMRPAE
ncbi:hypothetical protein ACIBSV_17185 [Embleya sp. NPDC050154]|uniref:hypothetical protein n=1 Tax=Embleya sp. NPDC050154 TaxID=3363988 RepID=UPI0037BB15B3